jgi:hypothetical protein
MASIVPFFKSIDDARDRIEILIGRATTSSQGIIPVIVLQEASYLFSFITDIRDAFGWITTTMMDLNAAEFIASSTRLLADIDDVMESVVTPWNKNLATILGSASPQFPDNIRNVISTAKSSIDTTVNTAGQDMATTLAKLESAFPSIVTRTVKSDVTAKEMNNYLNKVADNAPLAIWSPTKLYMKPDSGTYKLTEDLFDALTEVNGGNGFYSRGEDASMFIIDAASASSSLEVLKKIGRVGYGLININGAADAQTELITFGSGGFTIPATIRPLDNKAVVAWNNGNSASTAVAGVGSLSLVLPTGRTTTVDLSSGSATLPIYVPESGGSVTYNAGYLGGTIGATQHSGFEIEFDKVSGVDRNSTLNTAVTGMNSAPRVMDMVGAVKHLEFFSSDPLNEFLGEMQLMDQYLTVSGGTGLFDRLSTVYDQIRTSGDALAAGGLTRDAMSLSYYFLVNDNMTVTTLQKLYAEYYKMLISVRDRMASDGGYADWRAQ